LAVAGARASLLDSRHFNAAKLVKFRRLQIADEVIE
jgi:hypothetical protein